MGGVQGLAARAVGCLHGLATGGHHGLQGAGFVLQIAPGHFHQIGHQVVAAFELHINLRKSVVHPVAQLAQAVMHGRSPKNHDNRNADRHPHGGAHGAFFLVKLKPLSSRLFGLGLAANAAQRRRKGVQARQADVGPAVLACAIAAVFDACQGSAHGHQLVVVAAGFGIAHSALGHLVGLGGVGILRCAVGRFHAFAVGHLHSIELLQQLFFTRQQLVAQGVRLGGGQGSHRGKDAIAVRKKAKTVRLLRSA